MAQEKDRPSADLEDDSSLGSYSSLAIESSQSENMTIPIKTDQVILLKAKNSSEFEKIEFDAAHLLLETKFKQANAGIEQLLSDTPISQPIEQRSNETYPEEKVQELEEEK